MSKVVNAMLSLVLVLALTLVAGGLSCITPVVRSETVINEIMFDPVGDDAGNEWIELYNNGTEAQNINGWTLSNRAGAIVATLPNWIFPNQTYLLVYFGDGTNDDDFSDGAGSFYSGINAETFNNTEDEVALYAGSPDSSAIRDFVSWCADGNYSPGTAHDYAVSADIWDDGGNFDTGFPTGKTIWDGNPIGRDKSSTDTDQSDDWDSKGGVDAYYPTPGAKNTGPLYSTYDGIKLTQLKVNLLLSHWSYRFTDSNHTILEEYQTDDETYVRANHYFEASLDGIIEYRLTGEAEYHWYKMSPSAWIEEINFVLYDSDLSENFSANYTKESVTSGLENTIVENLSLIHSYEVFNTTERVPDVDYTWDIEVSDIAGPLPHEDEEPLIPNPPVRVEQESYTSGAHTTITQKDSNRYSTEVIQDVNDRGVIWNVSFVKDELTSYGQTEAWTTVDLTNNVEGTHSISTHYNMELGEELLAGGLGDLDVNYIDYTLISGNKTFALDGPGYIRMEKVSDSLLDVVANIQVANVNDVSETLDLGSSGNLELLNIDGEEIITGYFVGNTAPPKIRQYYVDGSAGAGIGAVACAAAGYLASSLVIGAPAEATNPVGWATWLTRALLTVGSAAVCAVAGSEMEADKTPPTISFEVVGQGSTTEYGWIEVKITITDADSGLSKSRVTTTEPTSGETRFNKTYTYTNWKIPDATIFTLYNKTCKPEQRVITVTAFDDSAAKNQDSEQYTVTVPPRICESE